MSRFLSFGWPVLLVVTSGVSLGLLGGVSVAGCGSADTGPASVSPTDSGTIRRDAAPVDPTEAGPALDASAPPAPSCSKYCELVMTNCKGKSAQYASVQDCLAFCDHLPLVELANEEDEKEAASVACRQYWADTPARTSPETYCLAAGPFGGNTCGDRCTAFCGVLLNVCSPDGGMTAYPSQPECASACAGFTYRDAGVDGGGEGPSGPESGDTLNCRLYWLRSTTKNAMKCQLLEPQSDICKD